MRLSIIVPAYKVADYIEKCIRSLEDQDIPKSDYEIIVTNDGSPDDCQEIVERLQKEFSNIVLINQENQGVSMARNNAIAIAKGTYLLMIDPDDYLVSNSLKEKLEFVFNNLLDVGICSFVFLNETGNAIYNFNPTRSFNKTLDGIDFFNHYYKGKSFIKLPDRSCGIFYKKDFLISNKLFYLKNVPYLEDGEFLYRVFCMSKKVDFILGPFYIITTRKGSATYGKMVYSEKVKSGLLMSAKNLRMYQSTFHPETKEHLFLNQPIIKYLFVYLTYYKKNWFLHYLKIHKTIKKDFPSLDVKDTNAFYSKFALHYNVSLFNFYFYFITYNIKRSLQLKFKNISK
jgi:glycosyltransferase involved in cell wall biosynthesis